MRSSGRSSRPFPNRKPKRENRIKNACLSNSHSNIATSNDKRPLFVQIPATSSASLVSTSLPIQCLQPSNFFFFRGIFPNSFLCDQNSMTHERNLITDEQKEAGARTKFDDIENYSGISSCKRRSYLVVCI